MASKPPQILPPYVHTCRQQGNEENQQAWHRRTARQNKPHGSAGLPWGRSIEARAARPVERRFAQHAAKLSWQASTHLSPGDVGWGVVHYKLNIIGGDRQGHHAGPHAGDGQVQGQLSGAGVEIDLQLIGAMQG